MLRGRGRGRPDPGKPRQKRDEREVLGRESGEVRESARVVLGEIPQTYSSRIVLGYL